MKIDNLLNELPHYGHVWQFKNLRWLLGSVLILCLDQWTKIWISHLLLPQETWPIVKGFSLNLVFNFGASFSFLNDGPGVQQYFLIAMSLLISCFLFIWLCRIQSKQIILLLGISLVLGGAWGNLWDRIKQGYVIDFITLYYKSWYWPTFNVADIAICCGAFILILKSWKSSAAQ